MGCNGSKKRCLQEDFCEKDFFLSLQHFGLGWAGLDWTELGWAVKCSKVLCCLLSAVCCLLCSKVL